ncbi:MAG: DUF1566 domain-containing protein [Nitrospina sp.]|nr:MAG: DUF1566 domain-containing protein [Nitrospina sp.]
MADSKRFIDNGDSTITDTEKNLMWTKTDSMIELKKWVNYQDSVDWVRVLNENEYVGYSDWRLPTRDEMSGLYDESFSNSDKFGKLIHISDVFTKGCGFSVIAKMIDGRFRTWVLNLRDGEYTNPDGLWTLTEAARAVRTIVEND